MSYEKEKQMKKILTPTVESSGACAVADDLRKPVFPFLQQQQTQKTSEKPMGREAAFAALTAPKTGNYAKAYFGSSRNVEKN